MAVCDPADDQFDAVADGNLHVGRMPDWMHVRGKAVWWVHQGGYKSLGDAWATFHKRAEAADVTPAGPPGDVYVCDPDTHREDPDRILTVLWMPVE